MKRGGFERALDGVRGSEAPWEKLMEAPRVLRAAVDVLGADVAAAGKAVEVVRARDRLMHVGAGAHGACGLNVGHRVCCCCCRVSYRGFEQCL